MRARCRPRCIPRCSDHVYVAGILARAHMTFEMQSGVLFRDSIIESSLPGPLCQMPLPSLLTTGFSCASILVDLLCSTVYKQRLRSALFIVQTTQRVFFAIFVPGWPSLQASKINSICVNLISALFAYRLFGLIMFEVCPGQMFNFFWLACKKVADCSKHVCF